jgi:hypothetical protein
MRFCRFSDPASMNGRPCTSGRGRPAALVLPRRCRRGTLPTPRRSHWPSACHPWRYLLPSSVPSPANGNPWSSGRQDDFAGILVGRTARADGSSRGRPQRSLQTPAAGRLARGSSCHPPGRRVVLRRSGGAAQVVAGAGFRLAVGGECRLGGQVGVCGGEVICSGCQPRPAGTAGPAPSWPQSGGVMVFLPPVGRAVVRFEWSELAAGWLVRWSRSAALAQ